MRYIIYTLLFILLIPLKLSAAESIGTYTDEKGRTVYTNIKEPRPASTPHQGSIPTPYPTLRPKDDASPRIPMPRIPQQPATVRRAGSIIDDIYDSLALFIFIFVILPGIVWIICLIDILTSEFTGSNKIRWFFVSLLLPYVGPLLYYFIGLNQKKLPDFPKELQS